MLPIAIMIVSTDAAAYSVLLLDVLLRYQMIANHRKTRNSHLIDTRNQNKSYGTLMCVLFFKWMVDVSYV